MGVSQQHILGRTTKFFVTAETTAGTFKKPVSADAVKTISRSIAANGTFDQRIDSSQNRSANGVIQKKTTLEWSASTYLLPSGAAGTPPDAQLLLKAAIGASGYTNTPSTSDVYLPTSEQTVDTLTITAHNPDVFASAIHGAYVESLKISQSGGDEPRVEFSGGGMGGYVRTATDTVATTATGTTLTTSGTDQLTVGSVIKIGSNDNSGAGFEVTAGSGTSYTISASAAMTSGDAVIPFTPTEVTTGAVLGGLIATVKINGTTYPVTDWEVTLANNSAAIESEVGSEYPSDVTFGKRAVGFTCSMFARKDRLAEWSKRFALGTATAQVVVGSVAGKKMTIDLKLRFQNDNGLEIPDDAEGVLKFTAIGDTSTGDDELKITFN